MNWRAIAPNLCTWLNAEYDQALASYDVLVMPTLPLRATVLASRRTAWRGSSPAFPWPTREHSIDDLFSAYGCG